MPSYTFRDKKTDETWDDMMTIAEMEDYLKKNKRITSWFAIQEFGITRLADVIHRLRKEGYAIEKTMATHKNARTGKVSTFAKYKFIDAIDVGSNYELSLG